MATLLRILKHRAVITLLVVVGLATALQLAAPPVIRSVAIHWLHEHGVADAEIGAIRINPFTWTLAVHGLKAGPGLQAGRAEVNLDWWPLWHHRIYVRDLALDHARLTLEQSPKGAWKIAGLDLPAAAPAAATSAGGDRPWYAILHRARLRDVRIRLSGHDLKLDVPIQSLDMDHALLSQAGSQTLNTTLRLGPSAFSGLGYRLADAGLLFQGQVILPAPGASPDTAGAGHATIRLRGLSLATAKGTPSVSLGRLQVSGVGVHGVERIKLGDVEADDLALHADLPGAADTRIGHIAAKAIQYANGALDLDTLRITDIRATDASRRVSLGAIGDIAMQGLSVDHDRQGALARLAVHGITLPATGKHAMGRIGDITVTDARLAASRRLQASRLDIRGLNLSLLHDRHGLAVLNRLQPGPSKPAARNGTKQPAHTAAAPLPDIHIGKLSIDKGSRIAFTDDAVNPPFQDTLTIDGFDFSPLVIGGDQTGKLDAAFEIGDQGRLSIRGDMNLDRADPTAKLDIVLKRLSMPALSGYLARSFGYTIGTGQMDLNSRVNIRHHAIDAGNKLAIRNLALNATGQSDKSTQSLGMPLDMAVSMLRNDRGDIALNVPVSGRLDDPNVNINDAINQALTKAIKSGAMSYASLLLQPYGSILPALSFAKGLIEDASKPRLTPIAFAPRTASLSDEAKAYIGKIAQLMKQKPFRLQVCGVASEAEVAAESAAKPGGGDVNNGRLLSLAKARSSAVIEALVAAGIHADRVFACLPKIDKQPKAAGRVELLLN